MYSLDVNFLKDRHLETSKTITTTQKSAGGSLKKQTPLFIGAGVGLALVALTGGFIALLNLQKSQTESNIAELDQKIGQLNAQTKSIEEIKAQIEASNAEVAALVSVFNQIKPWSALMEEIKNQIPENVQITSIQEVQSASNEGQAPGTQLNIQGYAQDYKAVNDFLLTLQNSRFLKADRTVIQSAQQVDNLTVSLSENSDYTSAVIPKVVEYTIITELNNLPAAQMRRELASRGAVGLVSRLRTLEQTGAMK